MILDAIQNDQKRNNIRSTIRIDGNNSIYLVGAKNVNLEDNKFKLKYGITKQVYHTYKDLIDGSIKDMLDAYAKSLSISKRIGLLESIVKNIDTLLPNKGGVKRKRTKSKETKRKRTKSKETNRKRRKSTKSKRVHRRSYR